MDRKFIAEGGIEVTDEMLEEWAAPWERGMVSGAAADFVWPPGRSSTSEAEARIADVGPSAAIPKTRESIDE